MVDLLEYVLKVQDKCVYGDVIVLGEEIFTLNRQIVKDRYVGIELEGIDSKVEIIVYSDNKNKEIKISNKYFTKFNIAIKDSGCSYVIIGNGQFKVNKEILEDFVDLIFFRLKNTRMSEIMLKYYERMLKRSAKMDGIK